MKIVVLCGEDEIKSRNRYFQIVAALKKRGWEHVTIDTSKNVSEQLVGSSLFDVERIYTIDKPEKVSEKEYQWISKHLDEYSGSLLIYFKKAVPSTIKKFLPKSTKYEEFKLNKKLFVFIESIFPGNAKNSLSLFHEVISVDPPELVLGMMARHFKDLYLVKTNSTSTSIPDWRRSKLKSQLTKFSGNKLEKFINDLLEADLKSKTGEGDLTLLLDLILVKL